MAKVNEVDVPDTKPDQKVCSLLNTVDQLLLHHCLRDARDINPDAAFFITKAIFEIRRAEKLIRLYK